MIIVDAGLAGYEVVHMETMKTAVIGGKTLECFDLLDKATSNGLAMQNGPKYEISANQLFRTKFAALQITNQSGY